jgi:hypothetical protein
MEFFGKPDPSQRDLQRKLLQVICEGTRTLGEVLDSMNLTREHLARWSDDPQFRRELKVAERRVQMLERLELEMEQSFLTHLRSSQLENYSNEEKPSRAEKTPAPGGSQHGGVGAAPDCACADCLVHDDLQIRQIRQPLPAVGAGGVLEEDRPLAVTVAVENPHRPHEPAQFKCRMCDIPP